MNKTVEVFATFWNEEKTIQDFIDWYRSRLPDCKITIVDNLSDDNTIEIAKSNGCNVIHFDTSGYMDENTLMNLRNNVWKNSNAEWVIVVDSDEFIDINYEIINNLTSNVVKFIGYDMYGTGEPIDELCYGCFSPGYSKAALFNRIQINHMNFGPGSHTENPIANNGYTVKYEENRPNLYHTKWRSWSNGIERAHLLAKRRSDHSRKMGWNYHYEVPDQKQKEIYENGLKTRTKVR
jgi:glycosyltransferase involved in cell wall biosynthesis